MECESRGIAVTVRTKWLGFSWTTLPLLSTALKVVHIGILSCCSYFESIIHYDWILQRVRETFKSMSSRMCIRNGIVFHTP